jgi:hypothetical protein
MTKFTRLALLLCMPIMLFANTTFSQNSPSINQKQLKKDLIGHWKVVDTEIELGNFLEELNQMFGDSTDQVDFNTMFDELELLESLKQTYNSWHLHFFKNGDVFFEMSLPLVENLTEQLKWRYNEKNSDIMIARLDSPEYMSAFVLESYDVKNKIMKVRLNSNGNSTLQVTLWLKRVGKPNKKLYVQSKIKANKKIIGTYKVSDVVGLEIDNPENTEGQEYVDILAQTRTQNITFYSDGLYVVRDAQTNQALSSGTALEYFNTWMMLPNDVGLISNLNVEFLKNSAIIFVNNYWGDEVQILLDKEKKMVRPKVPDFNSKAQKKGANTFITGSWRAVRNTNNILELAATWDEEMIDAEDFAEYFTVHNYVFYALEDQKAVVFEIDASGNLSFAGYEEFYVAGKLVWNQKQRIYELTDQENNYITLEKLSNDFVRIIIKNPVYGEIKFICEASSDAMDFMSFVADLIPVNSDWDFDWFIEIFNNEFRPLEENHPIYGTWTISTLSDVEIDEYHLYEFFFTWDTITIFSNGTIAFKLPTSETDELVLWTLTQTSDDTLQVLNFSLLRNFEIRFISENEFEIKDPLNEDHHFKLTKIKDNPKYSVVLDEQQKLIGCWVVDSTIVVYSDDSESAETDILDEFDIHEILVDFITHEKFCLNIQGRFEQTITLEIKEGNTEEDETNEENKIEDFILNDFWNSRAEQWYFNEANQEIIINRIFSLEINKILSLTDNTMILEHTDANGKKSTLYLSR